MTRADYYVYVHRAKGGVLRNGDVFYVGKGTGDRAWRRDTRHTVWGRYVQERIGGEYTVEIVQDNLDEQAALDLEERLIQKYGSQLINWQNPGRNIDYHATERFWTLRKESQRLTELAKDAGKNDPSTAVEAARQALELVHEYSQIEPEDSLVSEFAPPRVGSPTVGDPEVIYRLALSLQRAGEFDGVVSSVDEYLSRYPDSVEWSATKNAIKIRDRALARRG
jgi:hypothetical protein